jgi:hypothetical protein
VVEHHALGVFEGLDETLGGSWGPALVGIGVSGCLWREEENPLLARPTSDGADFMAAQGEEGNHAEVGRFIIWHLSAAPFSGDG